MTKHQEEFEASHQAKGASFELREAPPFDKINLLETFFTGVAQPISAADGEITSQKE